MAVSNEQKIEELKEEIESTFEDGGTFAHNLISSNLRILAKLDKAAADKVYADLIERGF